MIEQASLVIGGGNWAVKSDSLLGYKINGGKYYPREMSVVRATTGTRINEDGLVEVVPYNLLQRSEEFENAIYTKGNVTATANSETAPNGTLTADTITGNGTSNLHSVIQNSSIVSGTTYTTSIYAKKGTNNFVQIVGSSVIYPATVFANFDLENGVVGSLGAATTSSIESVGNGWYRCSMTATATASATSAAFFVILIDNASSLRAEVNTLATSVYLWGAQLVEGSTAKDYLPTTDRLDVARIDYSSGSGALLLEPQRTNIAFPSSNSSTNFSLVNTSFLASQINGLSGTLSGALISETVATGIHYYGLTNGISVTLGTAYTFSIYLKKGNGGTAPDIIQLTFNSGGFGSVYANFNISTGIVTLQSGVVATISEGVNGYYRCSITATATSTNASTGAVIGFANNNPTSSRLPSYVGLTTSNVFYDGFQVEAGAYATSYIPTTTAIVTRNKDTTVEKDLTSFGIGNSYTLLFDLTMATEDSNKILFYLKNSAGADSFTFRNFSGILSVYDAIGLTYPLAALANESTKWAFRFDGVNYSLFRVSGGVAVKNTATLGTARNIGYLNSFNISGTKASLKLLAIEPSALTDAECEQFVIS